MSVNKHQDSPPGQNVTGNRDVEIWNQIAGFWDQYIKEGNDFQEKLIMPTTDRLLGDVSGKRILDACCGNGNYSRKLVSRGAKVTAFDGSKVFIELARAKNSDQSSIDYHVINACDEAAILNQIQGPFDAAICSMAMMDLPVIEPLLRAVRKILASGAPFIFSVCHPAFNSPLSRNTGELVNENGRLRQKFAVVTDHYITPYEALSEGIINQPQPHPMYHRPISLLLKSCFDSGYIVDALEEPAFPLDTKSKSAFSWAKRPEIPPALVVRIRPV